MKQIRVSKLTNHSEREMYFETKSKFLFKILYYWFKLRNYTIEKI